MDPYARADFFISFSNDSVDVEEGYATFTQLPAGLLLKVGKFKAQFGKINTLHPHVLPWADEPLPMINLLGSEDGWSDAGVSLAKLIPLGDTFSELTAQVFRGKTEGLFDAPSRSDLSYLAPVPRLPRLRRRPQRRARRDLGPGLQRNDRRREDDAREHPPRLPLEAAPGAPVPLLHPAERALPQPPRAAGRDPDLPRLLRLRRLPARQAVVYGGPLRILGPGGRPERPGFRRGVDVDFLAKRVLPGSRRASKAPLRGRDHRQRRAPSTSIRDRRPRRPSLLV